MSLVTDPGAWAALGALAVMEVVLGVDNLVFVAVLSNTLPAPMQAPARLVGLGLALVLRLVLLAGVVFLVGLTAPLFTLVGHAFSARDVILAAGGLFLLWKATQEIHHATDPDEPEKRRQATPRRPPRLAGAIVQILVLDVVFSVDSILTAVGMTDRLPIMARR